MIVQGPLKMGNTLDEIRIEHLNSHEIHEHIWRKQLELAAKTYHTTHTPTQSDVLSRWLYSYLPSPSSALHLDYTLLLLNQSRFKRLALPQKQNPDTSNIMASKIAVKALDHIVLTVHSIPASVAFYEKLLGMKHQEFTSPTDRDVQR